MAVTLEQVEALRARAEVSYEEARAALEDSGGDLLDALIALERAGKLRPDGARGAFFTTRPGGEDAPPPPPAGGPAPSQVPAGERPRFFGLALTVGGRRRQRGRREGSGFGTKLKELLLAAADLLRHCTVNQFEVWRGGERMTSLPVLILILLVVLFSLLHHSLSLECYFLLSLCEEVVPES